MNTVHRVSKKKKIFRYVNSISRLCLCFTDTSLNFKLAIKQNSQKKKIIIIIK